MFRALLTAFLRTRFGYRFAGRLQDALVRRFREMQAGLLQRFAPDSRVIAGPFRGMYFEGGKSEGSQLMPKLLGTYEEELHEIVERCLAAGYADVIDIGCDFGYYAIGFARRLPAGVRVFALDLNRDALRRCAELAERNGVTEKLVIEFGCTPDQLREIPVRSPCLIICDCEGAEGDLLHPQFLPSSAHWCDMLIETHDLSAQANMASELIRRFAATHTAQVIRSVARDARNYPLLAGLSSGELEMALGESRTGPMEWLFLAAKRGA